MGGLALPSGLTEIAKDENGNVLWAKAYYMRQLRKQGEVLRGKHCSWRVLGCDYDTKSRMINTLVRKA